jgi:hypothetical protein
LAICDVLRGLGVDPQKIEAEMHTMSEHTVAATNDRRVLGSMNDFTNLLESYLDGRPLVEVALHLAEAPCSPLGMDRPRDVARKAFSAPTLRLVKG